MNDVTELLARVEAATGPNVRIDAMLHAIFAPDDFDGDAAHYAAYPAVNRADMRYLRDCGVKPYTASIDAALALVERKLPGQWHTILREALLLLSYSLGWASRGVHTEDQRMLPRMIIIALLRALSPSAPTQVPR